MTSSQRRYTPPPVVAAKAIELRARGDFVAWLAAAGGTLAVTTYNSGKLALFAAVDDQLKSSFWRFPRPMGLAVSGEQIALASQRHIWLLRIHEDEPVRGSNPASERPVHVEAVFATGRVDAHDLAFDRRGLLFANTRFNCISRPSERVSFQRTWQPPFIPKTVRQDCCHLNGLGVRAGRLAMATAFCESSAPAAWRETDRFHSGVLIDVQNNRIAARGLCMPHSPRWHEGRWWFCNSGEGALCMHLRDQAATDAVAVLPGFTRGLTFAAGRAIVGLSRIRKRHILDAPPVRQRFPKMRSGIWLVDPATGRTTGALEFIRGGREVYDVAHLAEFEGPAGSEKTLLSGLST
jgi:uncharacterized protein (TIGR03032 family)